MGYRFDIKKPLSPLWLETTHFLHRRAPKVIEENLLQRSFRTKVLVVFYRTDIVEYEVTLDAVVVAHKTGHTDD